MKFKASIDAKVSPEEQAKFGEVEKARVREQLGLDQARFIITGSAPCPRDIQQWFINMGIKLRDGYGMTETFIDGCFWNSDDTPVPGCVGKPFDGVGIKLTEVGEICYKTNAVMKGYYKNPEKTAEVLIDGWYHTGDSGRFDEQGNLWVTGRISEVFKTTKGKFIKPSNIEDRFGGVAELGELIIFGHGKDQPLMLASLSEAGRRQNRKVLTAKLEDVLTEINAKLPNHERVAQVFVTATEWSVEGGLLTPTMKVKRKAIEAFFGNWVSANSTGGRVVWQ